MEKGFGMGLFNFGRGSGGNLELKDRYKDFGRG